MHKFKLFFPSLAIGIAIAHLLLAICAVIALAVGGCANGIHVTKNPLEEVSKPVTIKVRREGFDTVYMSAELVGNAIYIDGILITDNIQYDGAVITIMEKR